MAGQLSALDTASAEELTAALAARLRARLGQTCGGVDDFNLVITTAMALQLDMQHRVRDALMEVTGEYIGTHPAWSAEVFTKLLLAEVDAQARRRNPVGI